VRFPADDGRFDLRTEGTLALGEHVNVALRLLEALLGEAKRIDLRLERFEVALIKFRKAAGIFDAESLGEPLLLGREARFVAFGLALQLLLLTMERLQPIALLAEGVDPRRVAH
jgi:hypothetical protein